MTRCGELKVSALRELAMGTAEQLQAVADPSWRWHGLNAKLVDGSTITMPDTEENQKEFPQQKNQRSGVGLPIARCCVVLLLATGACRDERELWRLALDRIAANLVANRPGRIEPRVIKRRRHRYPLMRAPREKLHRALSDL